MKDILIAAIKSGVGTLVTLLSSALAIKIIALFSGPAGVGLFSLLRQTQQTASIVGAMGGQAAIVQGLSGKEGAERALFTGNILRVIIVSTAVICGFILVAAPWLAPLILVDLPHGVMVFRLLAIPTLLGSAVLFFCGVINSHRTVGILSLVQIASGLSLAVFAYKVSIEPSGVGFLFLLSVSGLSGLLVASYFIKKNNLIGELPLGWWKVSAVVSGGGFVKLGTATLLTGLMSMGAVLIVRTMVSRYHGYASAGIFDAAWTLSMTYVMLILTSFSAYYLPTLGTFKAKHKERNILIEQYFRFATFSSIPLIAVVMLIKPWVIELLYSKEFIPAVHIMRWMLLGDFFKIASWVLAMPMLAYADIRPYVLSEFFWNIGFVLLTYISLNMGGGIENIGIVFMILYIVYFLYAFFYCVKKFKIKIGAKLFSIWSSGFAILLVLSLL